MLSKKIDSFILMLLLLFTISIVNAIETNNKFYFSNLKSSNSLSSTDIFSITSDSKGFIWIGTGDGLFRYDGYDLVEAKDNGMPLRVISLIPDSANGLWIGGSGLKYLDTRTHELRKIDLHGNYLVRTMYNDYEYLLIGTESGLLKVNKESGKTKVYNSKNSGLSNNIVRAIFKDKNGDLWIGTSDKLNYLKNNSSKFESFDLKEGYKPEITYNHILDIKPFSESCDSLLWVGTETGLSIFNKNSYKYKSYNVANSNISNDAIKSIYPLGNGKLWLGTDFGLNLFDVYTEKSEVYLHQPDKIMSIADNVVWSIYKDNAEVYWFGTSNGISRIGNNINRFNYYPVRNTTDGEEFGDVVKAIIPIDSENIWIGTNNGVSLYNFNKGTLETLSTQQSGERKIGFNKIQALHTDASERLWIGSVGGVFIKDSRQGKMYKITSDNKNAKNLKSNYINKFIHAPDSSFWVSIWQRGIYEITGDFRKPELLSVNEVLDVNTDLIVYGNKNIWLVDDNKLLCFNPETRKTKELNIVNKLIETNYIRSIYYSSNGKLWMGGDNTIFEFDIDTKEVVAYEIESNQGLKILSFQEDFDGNLWMSSQNSILKFDINKKETNIFVLGNEFLLNGFVAGCSAKTPDGKIIFGGNDGMIVFNPSEIVKDSYSPSVVISGLKVYNRKIWAGDKIAGKNILEKNITFLDDIELPYNNRSFTISFASLHYGAPEKNVYSYKLEGLDNRWHSLTGSNSVTYSGLTPGKYSFKVKGTNNDGVWQENEAKIAIRILPPLWRRWYFILGVCVLLIGVLSTILYFFVQKKNLARKVKEEQKEKRNIAALNNAKLQFFTNISHEFRTPLSLIVGPVKKLSNEKVLNDENRQLVNLINRNSQRMLRLVNQLMDFRKINNDVTSIAKSENDIVELAKETFELFVENAHEKNLHFILKSNCDKIYFEFDKPKVETILFNLLSNAFKFTNKGKIELHLFLNRDKNNGESNLEILVSDTGKGIAEEKLVNIFQRFYRADEHEQTETGTGIGLNIVKEFVELHKGAIEVNSTLNKGTIFRVSLPFGEKSPEHNIKDFVIEVIPDIKTTDIVQVNEFSTNKEKEHTLLIVEDNLQMASFIANCLKSQFNIFIENNGQEGVEKAIHLLPDIIISDVMMPLKSGTELCTELKSNINTSHIPIVLLTALDATEHKITGYETGADDYISKPFDEELLLTRIAGILRNRELLRKKLQLEKTIDPKKLSISTPDQNFLNDFMRIIEENIHERDLNTTLLTQELGMSRSVVYNKLKALTGQPIIDFIRDFKLKRAAQLLKEHRFSVTDACYKVGFSDRRYFTKIFKQRFGISPSDYKSR